jgi:hypothetical protein
MIRLNTVLGLALMFTTAAAACAAPEIPSATNEPEVVARGTRAPGSTNAPALATTDGGDDVDATDGTPADGGAPPAHAAPGTTTPAPASCAGTADFSSCHACCDGPAGGALARVDQAFEACSCGKTGACASVCGVSYCSGQKASAECNTCLAGTCDTAAAAECTTPACLAGKQCLKTACAGKP